MGLCWQAHGGLEGPRGLPLHQRPWAWMAKSVFQTPAGGPEPMYSRLGPGDVVIAGLSVASSQSVVWSSPLLSGLPGAFL